MCECVSSLLQLTRAPNDGLIDQTIVVPKGPDVNTEQEHSDIAHLCVMSMEVMVVSGPGRQVHPFLVKYVGTVE